MAKAKNLFGGWGAKNYRIFNPKVVFARRYRDLEGRRFVAQTGQKIKKFDGWGDVLAWTKPQKTTHFTVKNVKITCIWVKKWCVSWTLVVRYIVMIVCFFEFECHLNSAGDRWKWRIIIENEAPHCFHAASPAHDFWAISLIPSDLQILGQRCVCCCLFDAVLCLLFDTHNVSPPHRNVFTSFMQARICFACMGPSWRNFDTCTAPSLRCWRVLRTVLVNKRSVKFKGHSTSRNVIVVLTCSLLRTSATPPQSTVNSWLGLNVPRWMLMMHVRVPTLTTWMSQQNVPLISQTGSSETESRLPLINTGCDAICCCSILLCTNERSNSTHDHQIKLRVKNEQGKKGSPWKFSRPTQSQTKQPNWFPNKIRNWVSENASFLLFLDFVTNFVNQRGVQFFEPNMPFQGNLM